MLQKIRIASLAGDFGIGGTARQIVTIDKYLNSDFFEHYIVIWQSQDNSRVRFIDNKNVIEVSSTQELINALRSNKIDILYVHRHGRNQPEHDGLARDLPDDIILIELNTFSAFDRGYFSQRCDKHIFVSQTNVLKYLVQNKLDFDFAKHKVVYALVDSESFLKNDPDEAELQAFKKRHGLENRFVIGRIARDSMTKWDDKTIIFWKKACKNNPNVKFIIYGVPEQKKRQLTEAGIKENLIIMDPTTNDRELALFYSSLDVLVHLSPIGECSSATIAEAMLFKKPIVTTTTPFPRHVLGRSHTRDNGQIEQIKNGVNGYIVKSAAAMAQAVLSLMGNQAIKLEMGERNCKEVMEKYDANIGIKTLEKAFIESMMEKKADLSEQLSRYYGSISFYPSQDGIASWLNDYYSKLDDACCKDCRDGLNDRIFYLRNKLFRKFRTLLKKII